MSDSGEILGCQPLIYYWHNISGTLGKTGGDSVSALQRGTNPKQKKNFGLSKTQTKEKHWYTEDTLIFPRRV